MTTPSQQASLEGAAARVIYFVEFTFRTATIRVSTANITISWGGYDWIGLGSVGAISPVEESEGLESKSITFTLNCADPAWLAIAIGDVDEYRGFPAKMYFCPLDENFRLIDTPERCWSGIMDSVSVGLDGDEGQVALKCETAAYGLKRKPALRMNDSQQRKKYPSDSGFAYLNSLISQPALWLSKKFQLIS